MTIKLVASNRDSRVPVKIWTDHIESSAMDQLANLSKLSFVHKHVAVMPDVHAGIGSCVGTVIPTKRAIIPAAVGVDIGCGMMAARLNMYADQLPDNLGAIRSAIEAAIPHGRTDNGGANDRGAWGEAPDDVARAYDALDFYGAVDFSSHPKLERAFLRGVKQLGTLGTGNHFIELCLDTSGDVWLMLHSGSRGVGNAIGRYFIEKAKEEMERWHIELPSPDLAYLPQGTPMFDDYWSALEWAQRYASTNRQLMFSAALAAVSATMGRPVEAVPGMAINCHHNYAALENHFGENVFVTRKGAVRARIGDYGIIPGSMGARSFIVAGLGNPDSFCSCSHGAGRKMSRTEARKVFTVDDLKAQTAGVECRKDDAVVDEIPGAYKDIDEVMANQSDLVEVVAELRQVLCVKG